MGESGGYDHGKASWPRRLKTIPRGARGPKKRALKPNGTLYPKLRDRGSRPKLTHTKDMAKAMAHTLCSPARGWTRTPRRCADAAGDRPHSGPALRGPECPPPQTAWLGHCAAGHNGGLTPACAQKDRRRVSLFRSPSRLLHIASGPCQASVEPARGRAYDPAPAMIRRAGARLPGWLCLTVPLAWRPPSLAEARSGPLCPIMDIRCDCCQETMRYLEDGSWLSAAPSRAAPKPATAKAPCHLQARHILLLTDGQSRRLVALRSTDAHCGKCNFFFSQQRGGGHGQKGVTR
jgi:hypothetical protein